MVCECYKQLSSLTISVVASMKRFLFTPLAKWMASGIDFF